jgi:hypothetical protein
MAKDNGTISQCLDTFAQLIFVPKTSIERETHNNKIINKYFIGKKLPFLFHFF